MATQIGFGSPVRADGFMPGRPGGKAGYCHGFARWRAAWLA